MPLPTSLAVNAVMEMFRVVDGEVARNAVTAGAAMSTTTVRGDPNAVETLPAASFTHGYSVYVPSDATVKIAGAVPVQPAAPAAGGVAVAVTR
jgi:hypothetical protein